MSPRSAQSRNTVDDGDSRATNLHRTTAEFAIPAVIAAEHPSCRQSPLHWQRVGTMLLAEQTTLVATPRRIDGSLRS